MTQPEQLYTVAQAAKLHELGVPTIRRLIATGAIAVVRPTGGRAIRIPASELARLQRRGAK